VSGSWSTPEPILTDPAAYGVDLDSLALAVDTDDNWYVAYHRPNPSAQYPWAEYISSNGGQSWIAEVPYDCWYPDIDVGSEGRLHAVFYGLNLPSGYQYDSAIMYTNTEPTESAVIPAPGAYVLASIGIGFVTWLRRRRTL
jgi:hypothetical protein